MREPQERLFSGVKRQFGGLAGELRGMVTARWELAWLEIRAAGRSIRRLSIALALGIALVSVAMPVLVVWLCEVAANLLDVGRAWPLGIAVLSLTTVGAAIAFFAWRRFRREFVGLEETLEELHEDMIWLKEWSSRNNDADSPGETSHEAVAANSVDDGIG